MKIKQKCVENSAYQKKKVANKNKANNALIMDLFERLNPGITPSLVTAKDEREMYEYELQIPYKK